MLFLLLFLLLGSFSAGNANDGNDNPFVTVHPPVNNKTHKFGINELGKLNTTGKCPSFLICYEDGMPETNGKFAKRFHLANASSFRANPECKNTEHWANLSKVHEKAKIRTEFSFGFKNLSFADLTLLGDLDLDGQALGEGAFLDDNGCEKWLQYFAVELHLAKNVNITKHADCEWEFSSNGTTPKQPVIPTDGPNSSPVSGPPETKLPAEVSTPTSPSSTASSTTTTTVTTTTESPTTTTAAPVHWKKLIKADSFGSYASGDGRTLLNQSVLLIRGILESWAESLTVNLCPAEGCDEGANGRIYMQFGVSFNFNDDGIVEDCWLNEFENSKWGTNASCNASTSLFKRGEKLELVLALISGNSQEPYFIVRFGAIGIAKYARPGLKSPIKGDIFIELLGNIRARDDVREWVTRGFMPPVGEKNLNRVNLTSDNLQILGHVPMHAEWFSIDGYDWATNILYMKMDFKNKNITMERAQRIDNKKVWPVPGPFPFSFDVAGEDFDLRIIKESCEVYYKWIIELNGQEFMVNANNEEIDSIFTRIWARFTRFMIGGDFIYYGYNYLPSRDAHCKPKENT